MGAKGPAGCPQSPSGGAPSQFGAAQRGIDLLLWPRASARSEFWKLAVRADCPLSLLLPPRARFQAGSYRLKKIRPARPRRGRRLRVSISHPSSSSFWQTLGRRSRALGEFDFVFIDCEKEDYIRFFDMLHLPAGGIVVADNIISHSLAEYVAHVRSRPNVESMTLPVGKGLEVTRFKLPSRPGRSDRA